MTAERIFTDDDRAALVAALPELGARHVVKVFAAETQISFEWLTGPRRDRVVSMVRQRAMFRAWQLGFSYAAIARVLNRDHSTVKHGVQAEADRCGLDMTTLRRERDERGRVDHDDTETGS